MEGLIREFHAGIRASFELWSYCLVDKSFFGCVR